MRMHVLPVGLALLATTATLASDFRDRFQSVTWANFDGGGEVSRQFHLNAESYLKMATIYRPENPRELTSNPSDAIANAIVSHRGGQTTFAEFVANDELLDGVIILHRGDIVFEAYPHMAGHQRHLGWSVTKVVTSTVLASLVEQGRVNMDSPIESYLPDLAGSGWEGATVQNIADMASGIDCRDADGYHDTSTCTSQHEESLGVNAQSGRELRLIDHLKTMGRRVEPGTVSEYVSANTNVLALLVEAVSEEPFAAAIEQLIWRPIGAESDAMIVINDEGYSYASGGLHARLRDLARFGEIYTAPGKAGVLSQDSVEAIQAHGIAFTQEELEYFQSVFSGDAPARSGWQWGMIWEDGAMFKGGHLGQGIYVDPQRDIVIAWFGTGVNGGSMNTQMLPVGRRLAVSLIGDSY